MPAAVPKIFCIKIRSRQRLEIRGHKPETCVYNNSFALLPVTKFALICSFLSESVVRG